MHRQNSARRRTGIVEITLNADVLDLDISRQSGVIHTMAWRYQTAGAVSTYSERPKALMPADDSGENGREDNASDLDGKVAESHDSSVLPTVRALITADLASDADEAQDDLADDMEPSNKTAIRHDDGETMIDLETLQSRVEAAKRRRGQAGEQLRRERERLRKLLDLTERRFAEMRTIVARYEEDNRRILRENEQLRSMLNAVLSVEEDDSFSEEMENLVSRLGTIVSDDGGSAISKPEPVPSKPEPLAEPTAAVRRFDEPRTQEPRPVQPEVAKVATAAVASAAATAAPKVESKPVEAEASPEEPIEVVDIADAKARITEALAAVDRGEENTSPTRRAGFGFFRRGQDENQANQKPESGSEGGVSASEFADVLAELERSEAETQNDSDSFQYNLRPGPRSGN